MIKIGIIDDEILARKVLEEYCAKIDNFELVLSTGNPLEFINFIQQNEVDLIFLDIEMPELNGIEILRSMINPPKVILTTAYSEYALESYNYGVIDYLLKPVKIERFLKAINKVSASKIIQPKKNSGTKELQIKHDGMPVNISFQSILYIQSFGNYLKIFTDSRMYLISETLTNINTLLSENFQRTHKSYITNLDRVTKATRTYLLIDNNKVPVSATYKIIVSEKLEVLAKS
ncbi:DNA-binding response regulator [Aquimarina sp. AD10]|uniref:Two-component system response regulator n=1 Tax=Aquimarina aggregata TaxID=1642818 RepID=A0A163CIV9_9FLAO|nr:MULTISPECIES: LytTR family DNA-binding domain-containing protein [Aquimarina]AXT59546.1 DNA-binding response regulator [Aquimarina sp. AD10]KZS42461.1 two-component system response regulator [Aquimarina aggregata]RKM93445.1 DNA-binding response regulator [Aquimarina sp. AD10]